MADDPETTPSDKENRKSDGGAGEFALETAELLSQALDALITRARTEEPFSPDLTGGLQPTLDALSKVRFTYLNSAKQEIGKLSPEARATIDDQIRAIGGVDLLHAAIAVSQLPSTSEALLTRSVMLSSGARRVPWLEIAKEIINLLLDFIPLPSILKSVIRELLKIIDKFLEGMPHEDHAPPPTTTTGGR